MGNSSGWIKLHRSIIETPEWLSEPFTRAQAWVDLLLLANHKTGTVRRRGITVIVGRGQVGYSEDSLSVRWKWSKGKARRFLKDLIEMSRIERRLAEITVPKIVPKNEPKTVLKKTSVSNLIHIINYDKYQTNSTEDSTEELTENGTGTRSKRNKEIYIVHHADEKIPLDDAVREVLSFLNEKRTEILGSNGVKPITAEGEIAARLREGRTVNDLLRVLHIKAEDPFFRENAKYFHPRTLFRKSNLDKYIDEVEVFRAKRGTAE